MNGSIRTATCSVALLCMCLTGLSAAMAADSTEAAVSSPIAFMRAHDREVAGLVGSPGDSLAPAVRRQVKELINGVFDFEELSRLTLGDHWQDRSPQERQEFVGLYSGLVEEQNFDRFVKYYREGKFRYQSEEVDGDRATVHVTVPMEAEEVPVTYLLRRAADTRAWLVYDLVIDGASTAQVNGRTYSRYIRRHSYDKLLERLRSQLEKLEGPS